MKKNNFLKLAISIGLPFLAGAIGSFFTSPAISGWYSELQKPAVNPPSWVFGPAWTLLYILMGIAAFLVWKRGWGKREVRVALYIFGFHLILNAGWSIIFFGLKNPGLAFAEIVVLWVMIVWMTLAFYKISKTAGYLLLPYLLWVSFAGYLNYSIWLLN